MILSHKHIPAAMLLEDNLEEFKTFMNVVITKPTKNKMNIKNEIIPILKKQEELRSTLDEINRHRKEILDKIDSCINEIDQIFANLESNDASLYSKLYIDGRNELIARFEMDGELVEVTRNMCYKNPIDRIKITRKPILL